MAKYVTSLQKYLAEEIEQLKYAMVAKVAHFTYERAPSHLRSWLRCSPYIHKSLVIILLRTSKGFVSTRGYLDSLRTVHHPNFHSTCMRCWQGYSTME